MATFLFMPFNNGFIGLVGAIYCWVEPIKNLFENDVIYNLVLLNFIDFADEFYKNIQNNLLKLLIILKNNTIYFYFFKIFFTMINNLFVFLFS